MYNLESAHTLGNTVYDRKPEVCFQVRGTTFVKKFMIG